MKGSEHPRVGIAGAGLMGQFHLQAALRAGANLVSIADRDKKKASRLISKSTSLIYADAGKMIEDADLDILHICTDTSTHEELIRQAIERKVHIFVEKPMAVSMNTTRELLDEATHAGLLICPVHQYAFQKSMEIILQARRRIGTEDRLDLVFHSAGGVGVDSMDQYRVAADILPHAVSILQRLYPSSNLSQLDWHISSAQNGSWQMSAIIDGVAIQIRISLTARPTCIALDLWGSEGAYHANMFHDFVYFRSGASSRRTKITQPFSEALSQFSAASINLTRRFIRQETAYPGLRTLTKKFYYACERDMVSPVSPDDSIMVAEVRDMFLSSIRSVHQDLSGGITSETTI